MEPLRIAVVEDDLAILDMTEQLLAMDGYAPIGFTTAAAQASIEGLQLALVIVDLHMVDYVILGG